MLTKTTSSAVIVKLANAISSSRFGKGPYRWVAPFRMLVRVEEQTCPATVASGLSDPVLRE